MTEAMQMAEPPPVVAGGIIPLLGPEELRRRIAYLKTDLGERRSRCSEMVKVFMDMENESLAASAPSQEEKEAKPAVGRWTAKAMKN